MRIARSLVVVVAATAIGAAACGSSKSSTAATTTPTTPTTQAAPTTTAAPATTTTIDEAAAKTAITAAFVKFLDGSDTNFDSRVAAIQNGDSIKAVFAQLNLTSAKTPSYGKVTSITFLSADDCSSSGFQTACATVVYDIYLKSDPSKPALAASKGYATLDAGTWKVARQTFCALAGLANAKCPAG